MCFKVLLHHIKYVLRHYYGFYEVLRCKKKSHLELGLPPPPQFGQIPNFSGFLLTLPLCISCPIMEIDSGQFLSDIARGAYKLEIFVLGRATPTTYSWPYLVVNAKN